MAYDLEEQEQLDAFKTWWKANGSKVISAVIAVAVAFIAYEGWNIYQRQQTAKASELYAALTKLEASDTKNIQAQAAQLIEGYASTPYAGRAALLAAKTNYLAKDVKTAKSQLQWASENGTEDAVRALGLLQLAGLQLEEKAYDEALKTLAEKHAAGFDGLFADLRGDVLVAQGNKEEARKAYQQALNELDPQNRYHRFTLQKLEALGS
ncbi:YfgM family protein [Methylobacillus flagellatus]|uniref:YfgM family protein n=1 Tax=Methylobacillus flagellatus TaxID=405 RepID=UPI0010F57051|nr:tetratricopeptide repeat protein [Methylobacillus flagellatus]